MGQLCCPARAVHACYSGSGGEFEEGSASRTTDQGKWL